MRDGLSPDLSANAWKMLGDAQQKSSNFSALYKPANCFPRASRNRNQTWRRKSLRLPILQFLLHFDSESLKLCDRARLGLNPLSC